MSLQELIEILKFSRYEDTSHHLGLLEACLIKAYLENEHIGLAAIMVFVTSPYYPQIMEWFMLEAEPMVTRLVEESAEEPNVRGPG